MNPLVQPDPGLFIWTILTFLVLVGLLANRSAFLAIAGDEIEAYGWQNPPISFNLHRTLPENRLY